jgi:ABC-type branched-subunit amino acid transport system substrate-binding protein
MSATNRPRTDPGHLRIGACLSLSGGYARFGAQAAAGLEIWRSMDGAAELVIEDDHSDRRTLQAVLPGVAARCDVLLGPYSTQLTRTAGEVVADAGGLLWNHGGAGDDVQAAHPGHIVSVQTPAGRYPEPFMRYLAGDLAAARLWLVHGRGSFGRQVIAGARRAAPALGIDTASLGPGDDLPRVGAPSAWALLCAGLFEEDVSTVTLARGLPNPPHVIGSVAAGVREFGDAVDDPEGIFGIAQWAPRRRPTPGLGPAEAEFVTAYTRRTGTPPDYPAVQAVAAAVLAAHCARLTGGTTRELLWPAACALETETLFGGFTIDPADGVQTGHETVLVRWTVEGMGPAGRYGTG